MKKQTFKCGRGLSINTDELTNDAIAIQKINNTSDTDALIQAAQSKIDSLNKDRASLIKQRESVFKKVQKQVRKSANPEASKAAPTKVEPEKDLSRVFKSFGRKTISLDDKRLKGVDNPELIANIQNHFDDILLDHGFEQDKDNGIKGQLSQTILINGC